MTRRLRPTRNLGPKTGPGAPKVINDEGAALVEFAIAVPIFALLLALILDIGTGFAAARSVSATARSAARSASIDGEQRLADYRALSEIVAAYPFTDPSSEPSSNDRVQWVTIYRVDSDESGSPPKECRPGGQGKLNWCNVYSGEVLAQLSEDDFRHDSCADEPDHNWCPTSRAGNEGDHLGVAIWVNHTPLYGLHGFGLGDNNNEQPIQAQAVFALYFPET